MSFRSAAAAARCHRARSDFAAACIGGPSAALPAAVFLLLWRGAATARRLVVALDRAGRRPGGHDAGGAGGGAPPRSRVVGVPRGLGRDHHGACAEAMDGGAAAAGPA